MCARVGVGDTQKAKFMWPNLGPPGSCWPQVAPCTLFSGILIAYCNASWFSSGTRYDIRANIFWRTKLHVLSNWMGRRSKTQMLFAHQETISNAGNGPWWHVYHMTIMSVFQTSYGIQAKVIKHPNCMFVQLNGNEMKDKNVNFTWRNNMHSRQWLMMICALHENNTRTELTASALQLINVLWTGDAICQLRSVSTFDQEWFIACMVSKCEPTLHFCQLEQKEQT